MSLVSYLIGTKLPPESGYGIAALIGIVGINTIKKILITKLTKKTDDETP